MIKWHGYGRCKTRLSSDIGKLRALAVQRRMTNHTLLVAKYLDTKQVTLFEINFRSIIGIK